MAILMRTTLRHLDQSSALRSPSTAWHHFLPLFVRRRQTNHHFSLTLFWHFLSQSHKLLTIGTDSACIIVTLCHLLSYTIVSRHPVNRSTTLQKSITIHCTSGLSSSNLFDSLTDSWRLITDTVLQCKSGETIQHGLQSNISRIHRVLTSPAKQRNGTH